ncbi:Lipopolysaccharide export system ATP-binding protein LptB OS=Afipia felis OX=1035 GN=lptB_4 PE=4 SV=1 [Afipia felis]
MRPILSLKNIHKSFGSLEIIRGVDLDISEGERHAIIGPNGAGKTTLTNLISKRYMPTAGEILFEGQNVTAEPSYRLVRMGMGRSFQIINIFKEMTVFENLLNAVLLKGPHRSSPFRYLSSLRDVRQKAEEVLSLVNLNAVRNRLATELPYGEQRVLEIALTLASDPILILLDEPAAGLSAAETRDVTSLIKKVTEGKSLILIEHDMDVVFTLADRISVLHYGQILAQGTALEIRSNQKVKDVYLGNAHHD